MQLGVVVDPDVFDDLDSIISNTNASILRFPLWLDTDYDYAQFVKNAISRGVDLLPVLDTRAINYWGSKISYTTRFRRYAKLFPDIQRWEIGNEPDSHGDSSGYYDPRKFSSILAAARTGFGSQAYLISGGLVSGDPNYLRYVDLKSVNAIGLHPYAQSPIYDGWGAGYVGDLVNAYGPFIANKPLIVTEFGAEDQLFNDEHQRAIYHSEMISTLSSLGVPASIVFCYIDSMVQGFGLVDSSNTPKETCAAIHDS